MTRHRPAARSWQLAVALSAAAVGLALLVPVIILVGTGFLMGWKFQPIETHSMAPRYPAGSLAVIVPIDVADVERGMTIVFEDPMSADRLVAHRVVRQLPGDELAWETKGDANATSDPLPVHAGGVHGRIGWTVPALGAMVTTLRGPSGMLLLVGLPLITLVTSEVVTARRGRIKPSPKVGATGGSNG